VAKVEAARAAGMMGTESIVVRRCTEFAELQACMAMQKEVWHFEDADLVPLRMFVVAQKIGGQVIGAFDRKDLVGFLLSIPGSRSGCSYLHSHMLAVREQYRNSGLGQRLKWFQRKDAMARNFDLIEWTFDPLEIKNAYMNIVKLGAIARRYNLNQYGTTSSPLHGGLPTDRLVAEWWLRSRRVANVLQGTAFQVQTTLEIEIPAQINEWKSAAQTREQAKQVQSRNREAFLKAFSEGFAILGYERDTRGNGKFLLGRWDESWLCAPEV
jgi:predicted GNAT superfamily acetyltransferase